MPAGPGDGGRAEAVTAPRKKVFIRTWGCQMNEYDSARLGDLMDAEADMELAETPEEADVLLMNTCSIREKAQQKVFSELGRWKRLKARNPDLLIGVGGCVASQEGEALRERAPAVDLVFGPQTLHRVPEMLQRRKQSAIPVVDITFPEIEKFDCLPPPTVQDVSAFVSIMEGCSKYCSFCVVPYTRGEEISRPADDILREIASLTQQGVREIVLLGQNVNSWSEQKRDFAWLLHQVAALQGVERLRYTTSHPLDFSEALIDCHAELPQLARHVHLPVQSGSDDVLAAMKRNYTADDYRRRIDLLRNRCGDISVSSDFIVGFPTENEKAFSDTLKMIKDICFDTSYSFLYSPRPGTPAASLPDETPAERKTERLMELQQLLGECEQKINHRMLGQTLPCLVSDFSVRNPGEMQARTENQRVVNFAAAQPDLLGTFVNLRIDRAMPHSLRGSLTAEA